MIFPLIPCIYVEPLLKPMHMAYIVSFFKRTSYGYQLQHSTTPEASSSVWIDMYMTQNHSYQKQALKILKIPKQKPLYSIAFNKTTLLPTNTDMWIVCH